MNNADHPEPARTGTYSDSELRTLEADARYAHDRASLYRARVWGGKRAATHRRLRQLENVADTAATRLRHARALAANRPREDP
jgi:hypothetical protein